MTKRDVVTVVLLGIFTCGIYSIYWWYVTSNDLNKVEDSEDSLMNYILALLLGLVTCGIYTIFWYYKFFKKLDAACSEENAVLNLVLCIFTTPIVAMAICQSSINKLVDGK